MLQSKNLDVLHQGDSKSTVPQLHITADTYPVLRAPLKLPCRWLGNFGYPWNVRRNAQARF